MSEPKPVRCEGCGDKWYPRDLVHGRCENCIDVESEPKDLWRLRLLAAVQSPRPAPGLDRATSSEGDDMSAMFTMYHYVNRCADGTIHVQNAVGAMMGQHHVHTPKGFDEWAAEINPAHIIEQDCADCDCGAEPGETT